MIPPGEIIEIVGRLSSGRTSLLTSWLRDVTQAGAVTALVDTDEAFDPVSAARGGVDLRRLLWVRCGGRRDVALRATDLLVRCPGFALIGLDVGESPPRLTLAAAFRWRLAVRRADTTLAIVASYRLAGAGAGLALRTVRRAADWSGPGPAATRLAGIETAVQVVRARGKLGEVGVTSAHWWAA